MERHRLSIIKDEATYNFEIADYPHHSYGHCKFEVYQDGIFVTGFEPDEHLTLHICNDAGLVDPEVLSMLADEIEAHNWVVYPFDRF
ncbi:hypothetical protein [Mucilaginibacter pedocola]|uniref:Uncharacterized protein n=1 Tax=Mucilaginibacter pedocola TaxID=1792845 RepID=A0A1S9PGJ7_9SPHI|nr:hypothetical protein [Mucilaginibacter pedocola]OOQ59678.1 hypothetical protein BC343_05805 [Mucilaginibacter pedocola]